MSRLFAAHPAKCPCCHGTYVEVDPELMIESQGVLITATKDNRRVWSHVRQVNATVDLVIQMLREARAERQKLDVFLSPAHMPRCE